MKQLGIAFVLLAAVSIPLPAQRLDGCPTQEKPPYSQIFSYPSGETLDRGLQNSGVLMKRDALLVALGDSRADVRSLAAAKLGEVGKGADLEPLVRAWLAEKDPCTRMAMDFTLAKFASATIDATQHLGGQPWVSPFQACTATEPPVATMKIEQIVDSPNSGRPLVRISIRNQTAQTLALVRTSEPEQLLSATVLDPSGAPARVANGVAPRFRSLQNNSAGQSLLAGKVPTFVSLPPREDLTLWTWPVGETFDMSAAGTYLVRLGGKLPYLNTEVCSNTALVIVP